MKSKSPSDMQYLKDAAFYRPFQSKMLEDTLCRNGKINPENTQDGGQRSLQKE